MAGKSKGRASLFSRISELFSGGGETSVGLSIGTSSIKIVELKKTRKSWKLLHFGIIQLPEDAIVDREIVNSIAVVESIKTLVNQLKLKTKNVCTALSGTGVIIKRMSVEVQSLKELQDQVFWEAEQYLPFDISEVVMDYQLLSYSKDKIADVILVAVKQSTLDGYMKSIEEADLKPKFVNVDFFSLQDTFENNYPSNPAEAVAIVDIGAGSLKITIVHDGVPVFTKDSSVGGKNLTSEIQKHLNLSFADAETLKVGAQAEGMPQEVSDLMNIMCENFAGQIKRDLDYYNASSSGAPVAYILLAGGSSKIPGLINMIEDSVGLPTQMLNPFNSVSYDPQIFTDDYIAAIAPVAAIPVGLAIRAGTK